MSNAASFFSKKRSVDQTRGSNARVRLGTPSCSARMVDQRRNPNAAAKSGTPSCSTTMVDQERGPSARVRSGTLSCSTTSTMNSQSSQTRGFGPLQKKSKEYSYTPGMCLDDGPSVQFTGSGSEVEDEDHYTEFNQDQCDDYIQSFESAAVQDRSQYRTITILLQEQQAMLQSIIAKQEKFEAFQSRCEQMVEDLEKKVATQCPTPASSSDSSPAGSKRKRVVNRDLSVSTIHVF